MEEWNTGSLTGLSESFSGEAWHEARRRAGQVNEWFTPGSVDRAAEAIRQTMLRGDLLQGWLSAYRYPVGRSRKRIGIVMAGNLPLVGFADLLAVVAAGDRAVVKPSSKDRPLTEYMCREFQRLGASVEAVDKLPAEGVDGIIATGSDAAREHFAAEFAGIPALLRGSRTSVGVLTGEESDTQLAGLAEDMFLYWGMGCRSVTRLFVPQGVDMAVLTQRVKPYAPRGFAPYEQCYRYARAMAAMSGGEWQDGGSFVLCRQGWEDAAVPKLAEVGYTFYSDLSQVREWLAGHGKQLQCVVSQADTGFPRQTAFGQAQRPALNDYADGVDTMSFLLGL